MESKKPRVKKQKEVKIKRKKKYAKKSIFKKIHCFIFTKGLCINKI